MLLLKKGVYPFEHMNSWEKFYETLLPKKKDFQIKLNLEHISYANYMLIMLIM